MSINALPSGIQLPLSARINMFTFAFRGQLKRRAQRQHLLSALSSGMSLTPHLYVTPSMLASRYVSKSLLGIWTRMTIMHGSLLQVMGPSARERLSAPTEARDAQPNMCESNASKSILDSS